MMTTLDGSNALAHDYSRREDNIWKYRNVNQIVHFQEMLATQALWNENMLLGCARSSLETGDTVVTASQMRNPSYIHGSSNALRYALDMRHQPRFICLASENIWTGVSSPSAACPIIVSHCVCRACPSCGLVSFDCSGAVLQLIVGEWFHIFVEIMLIWNSTSDPGVLQFAFGHSRSVFGVRLPALLLWHSFPSELFVDVSKFQYCVAKFSLSLSLFTKLHMFLFFAWGTALCENMSSFLRRSRTNLRNHICTAENLIAGDFRLEFVFAFALSRWLWRLFSALALHARWFVCARICLGKFPRPTSIAVHFVSLGYSFGRLPISTGFDLSLGNEVWNQIVTQIHVPIAVLFLAPLLGGLKIYCTCACYSVTHTCAFVICRVQSVFNMPLLFWLAAEPRSNSSQIPLHNLKTQNRLSDYAAHAVLCTFVHWKWVRFGFLLVKVSEVFGRRIATNGIGTHFECGTYFWFLETKSENQFVNQLRFAATVRVPTDTLRIRS